MRYDYLDPRRRCWAGQELLLVSSASPHPLQYDFKLKQTKSKARKTSWVDPQSGEKTTRNDKAKFITFVQSDSGLKEG